MYAEPGAGQYSEFSGGVLKSHITNFKPEIRTFVDTLLVTWDIPDRETYPDFLTAIAAVSIHIVTHGLANGFLFRGSISNGEYLQSKMSIIGPAITDAASWYEASDWFGCITTPNCTQHINAIRDTPDNEVFEAFIEYKPPLKTGNEITLWCVN